MAPLNDEWNQDSEAAQATWTRRLGRPLQFMAQGLTLESLQEFLAEHADLIEWAHAEARCAKWQLSRERFAEALRCSAEKRFRDAPASAAEVNAYLRSLQMGDLALACACSDGVDAAWEFFVANFRSDLRAAARAVFHAAGARDETRADELADSLYADLYGVSVSGSGRRKSLFDYFHGRSKLSTWLRAVLAQRHVDLLRAGQRTVSLDAENGEVPRELAQRAEDPPADPQRERYLAHVAAALSAALGELTPRERLLLSYYYVDQLTLEEIGRTLREHESTVSRQLERTRRNLRERVTEYLLRGSVARDGNDGHASAPPMSAAQVELAFEYAVEDWAFDLSKALGKE